jgi:hypothetical protein
MALITPKYCRKSLHFQHDEFKVMEIMVLFLRLEDLALLARLLHG